MSDWISTKHGHPPVDLKVLIAIVEYDKDCGSYWSTEVFTGFWSCECEEDYEGWYLETYSSDKGLGWSRFIEMPFIRIEAWTLCPVPIGSEKFIIKNNINDEVINGR